MTGRLQASDLHPELRSVFGYLPNPPVRSRWLLAALQSGYRIRLRPRIPAGVMHRFVDLGEGAGVHVVSPAGRRPRPALLWIHGVAS